MALRGWLLGLGLCFVVACSGKSGKGGSVGAGGEGSDGQGGDGAGEARLEGFELRNTGARKVDLLLVVDDSSSMRDKQALLADAVPYLVQRLVTPRCVERCEPGDASCIGGVVPTGSTADAEGNCAAGAPELPPIRDMHVGVITSSMGSHGAFGPMDLCVDPSADRHARLLGSVRNIPGTYLDRGFLAWDARSPLERGDAAPGDSDALTFSGKLQEHVLAAGEAGCDLEATLEAWYRFLIDPEPPAAVVVPPATSMAVVQGIDDTVLLQRSLFLRPDSLVVIAMLSDEDDCSLVDEGYGWLMARRAPMYRSTSQCSPNPNDHCCQSCGEAAGNPGCPPPSDDAECKKGLTLTDTEDPPALRCWQQKQRFGFDLLYPAARYAEGLRSPTVPQRSTGQMVQNPLFASNAGAAPRDPALVRLLTITGVPWQDIADQDSITGPGLRFLSAAELSATARWDVILGEPQASPPVLPSDPLMVQSTSERQGRHPITLDPPAPSSSPSANANLINGHEHADSGDDPQYACLFPLATPRDCVPLPIDGLQEPSCDCYDGAADSKRPQCQSPEDGSYGVTQYAAKAYPGTRFLEVAKLFGAGATVASICPKELDPAQPSYGYNPAVDALLNDVRGAFVAPCLSRPLPIDEQTGRVESCALLTAKADAGEACDCAERGLLEVSGAVRAAGRRLLLNLGVCDYDDLSACDAACVCEIPQLEGADLDACQSSASPPEGTGFCYVNAMPNEPNVGNPALVQDCSPDRQRNLRVLGEQDDPSTRRLLVCEEQVFAP